MTKYEKAIYDIVSESHEHLTVSQVYSRIKSIYPKVVPATVYNNINKLWVAGLIRKVTVEGMPDRYDSAHRHDHLICKRCGKLADISLEDLTSPLRKQLGQDFLFYDLKVYCLCPECRAKENNLGVTAPENL